MTQAWAESRAGSGGHLLHIRGTIAGLTDQPLALAATPGDSAQQAPLMSCRDDLRMRAFRDRNWFRTPGDLRCGAYRAEGYSIRPLSFVAGAERVPVLVGKPSRESDDRGTILYLQGGPYLNVIRGLGHYALTNHLFARYGTGATILVPAYIGTDRVRIGDGDLSAATAEIDALLSHARDRRKPVCVVAYSMGSFAVAPLVRTYRNAAFLLLAPATSAPRTLVTRMKANGVHPTPLSLLQSRDVRTPMIDLPSDQALLRYVGAAATRTLSDRLGPGVLTHVSLAFAPDDLVVERGDVAALATQLVPNHIHRVARVGHGVEGAMAFLGYQTTIDNFIGSCLERGRREPPT